MIKNTNILKAGEGEARVGEEGPGQRSGVSDDDNDAPEYGNKV